MNKGESITIQRVCNGFQVMPTIQPGDCYSIGHVMVFQQVGSALVSPEESKRYETLLAWIHDHFEPPVDKPKP